MTSITGLVLEHVRSDPVVQEVLARDIGNQRALATQIAAAIGHEGRVEAVSSALRRHRRKLAQPLFSRWREVLAGASLHEGPEAVARTLPERVDGGAGLGGVLDALPDRAQEGFDLLHTSDRDRILAPAVHEGVLNAHLGTPAGNSKRLCPISIRYPCSPEPGDGDEDPDGDSVPAGSIGALPWSLAAVESAGVSVQYVVHVPGESRLFVPAASVGPATRALSTVPCGPVSVANGISSQS